MGFAVLDARWLRYIYLSVCLSTYPVRFEVTPEVACGRFHPTLRGVHPPWDHDAFSPRFRFPPIFEKFSDSVENFPNFSSSRNFFPIFIRKNFWWPFFSHRPQITDSPLCFPCFGTLFPLCFAKIIISPLLSKLPPCFWNINLLFTCFLCISFPPYFDHDAFMHHHPMHVLDAPVYNPTFT